MKFAVRLSILGIAFVAMFSIVGLRLWFVQIAEGPGIALAAEEQTWIAKSTFAPRGDIYDSDGRLLATSRMVPAVVVDRTFVQPDEREALITRLSALLGIESDQLGLEYEEAGINGTFQVATVSNDMAYQVNEMLDELPGVSIVKVPERVYLAGPTMAHVIGYLGLPSQAELDEDPDLPSDVRIGRFGVESSYEADLHGSSGTEQYRVRLGEIIDRRPAVPPVPGHSLVLTIDLDLQDLVELALEEGINLSNDVKDVDRAAGNKVFSDTSKGAVVVLDPQTFEVKALASFPDYDPQLFVPSISTEVFEEIKASDALLNRTIGGAYPPASTFKAVTYTVIEEENLPFAVDREDVDPSNQTVDCNGRFILPDLDDGSSQVKTDWYYPRIDFGWMDIHGALQWSCNKFFWAAGLGTYQTYDGGLNETVLQDWSHALGYGSPTGIDVGGEIGGDVPSRERFEEKAAIQRENPNQVLLHPSRLEAEGNIWQGGDLMDFAIGQGAFTATPLQVAVSYASIVNGGTVREPHVVSRVIDSTGKLVRQVDSPVVRTINISEKTRTSLLTDLNRVVMNGTAAKAFEGFGEGLELVGGKTGTAEISANKDNHAWFVGVAPIDHPQYVVVVLIEEGGSGGGIAAPVARHILQYLMGNDPTPIVQGERTD
jgi:penicillin-binding protein 2